MRCPPCLTGSRLRWLRSALCLLPILLISPVAGATSFSVDPIGFSLTALRPGGTLRISNTGDRVTEFQISVFAWTTDNGHQREQPSDGLALNPPIFRLAPGSTQQVRFALRRPAANGTELSYRLLIEEVPSNDETPHEAVRTVLRASLPVFIPPAEIRHQLAWEIAHDEGYRCLRAINSGNVHEKMRRITLTQDGRALLETPLVYLLPGETRCWPLPDTVSNALLLHADAELGNIDQTLTAEP